MTQHEIYLTLPVSEFERLHAEIKRHVQRIAELQDELMLAYSERDAAVTELRGLQWGLSNAAAEQHDIAWPEDEDDGGHEGSND